MPVISMFYGMIVMMYYFDNKKHHLPHIHIKYGEVEAVFLIEESRMIEGNLPNNKRKLVEAWIELHKEDLMANWQLAVNGETVYRIEPLK